MSDNGSSAPVVLRTRAFGMDLEADFAMPGIEPSPTQGDGRALSLRRTSREEVEHGFPEAAERIAELHLDDRLAVSIDAGGDSGYLAYAFDFGHARIAPDGREVLIAPFEEPTWVWQRYLTGQVLPLAALLQGLEVFHACVLGLDGKALAVVAPSGVGKTSTALRLALQGLDFVADDVLAVEPFGDGVRVHPGVGLANVRPGADELLVRLERSGLAKAIGHSDKETRLAIRRSNDTLPLGTLFVLNRFVDDRELKVERLAPVDPRVLLSSTFNFSIRTPDRMARQLDVCARVERSASVFRITCGATVPPEVVAETILEHAIAALSC